MSSNQPTENRNTIVDNLLRVSPELAAKRSGCTVEEVREKFAEIDRAKNNRNRQPVVEILENNRMANPDEQSV
jgi:hypothetical protein